MNLPKPQRFTTRLGLIQKISSKVYLKRFELIEPKEITFLPGQTVMLQVAAGVNRSMSIASPPSEKTSITVAHDVSPMGPYSQWTINAKTGDMINFIGPLGVFTLDRESPRKRVFIATGTGISPFRAMLLDQLAGAQGPEVGMPLSRAVKVQTASSPSSLTSQGRDGTSKGHASPGLAYTPPRAFSLYWGLRREEDIFWKEEFEALAAKHPNFKFILTLSQPSETWQGSAPPAGGWRRGRVGDHVFAEEHDLPACDFYLCGNRQMVSEMEGRLLAAGVPKEQVKKELFY